MKALSIRAPWWWFILHAGWRWLKAWVAESHRLYDEENADDVLADVAEWARKEYPR